MGTDDRLANPFIWANVFIYISISRKALGSGVVTMGVAEGVTVNLILIGVGYGVLIVFYNSTGLGGFYYYCFWDFVYSK